MEKLGIDLSLLVAQIVNFVVILAVYAKWIHKPFMKQLSNEHQKQVDLEKALATAQKHEEAAKVAEQKMRAEMDEKLKKEYATMKREVDDAKRAILAEAHEEATKIRMHNEELLGEERKEMIEGVNQEAYAIASAVLTKALGDVVDTNMQKEVTKEVVAKLPKMKKQ